jgi:hypothetical protein
MRYALDGRHGQISFSGSPLKDEKHSRSRSSEITKFLKSR